MLDFIRSPFVRVPIDIRTRHVHWLSKKGTVFGFVASNTMTTAYRIFTG